MTAAILRSRSSTALVWVSLVVMLVVYSFPFLYLVLTSFKPRSEAVAVPPTLLPVQWTLENYASALSGFGVLQSFGNSIQTALISTTLALVLAVPAAYAATRFRLRFGMIFLFAALVTRMIPPVALGVPLSTMFAGLGLRDSVVALAIAHTTLSLPLAIWLLLGFFEAVPVQIEEAAQVDGCSRWTAFRRVVLPLTGGGIAVAGIFAFLTSWNEFLFALLMTSLNSRTTPIVIANFQTQFNLDWGPMTALATLYSLPVIAFTLLLQRHIVSGMTLGAVKG